MGQMNRARKEEAKRASESSGLLDALCGAVMHFHTTMRVGQVIDNAMTSFQAAHPELGAPDLFYIPDNTLTLALREYVEKAEKSKGGKV